jgi:hypothetical protein
MNSIPQGTLPNGNLQVATGHFFNHPETPNFDKKKNEININNLKIIMNNGGVTSLGSQGI